MAWHPRSIEIQSFTDGELDPRNARMVEAHLLMCGECARRAARFHALGDTLHAMSRACPPGGLSSRVLNAVASALPVEELACTEYAEMASAYLDRELTDHDRDVFEAHVFICEKCFAELRQLELTAEPLRDLPPRPVPADLFERIVAAVEAEQGTATRFTWRRIASVAAVAAAAAALLAALLIPRGGAPEAPIAAPTTIAERPAELQPEASALPTPAPEIAAVPVAPVEEPAAASVVEAAPMMTRGHAVAAASASRTVPSAAAMRPVKTAGSSSTRTMIASEPGNTRPSRGFDAMSPVRVQAAASIPAPALAVPEPRRSSSVPVPEIRRGVTHPATPQPAGTPAPPGVTVIARAPRSTDPGSSAASSSSLPAVAPVSTSGSDMRPAASEGVRVSSTVPRQQGSRTLYQGTSGTTAEDLTRALAAVERRQSAWDNPRIGIEFR